MSHARANAPQRPNAPSMGRESLHDSAAAAGIIDVAHLMRMTFEEKALAAEVLGLFDRQAEMLLARMQQASPRDLSVCAHTLAGSAPRGGGMGSRCGGGTGRTRCGECCRDWRVCAAARGCHSCGASGDRRAALRFLIRRLAHAPASRYRTAGNCPLFSPPAWRKSRTLTT